MRKTLCLLLGCAAAAPAAPAAAQPGSPAPTYELSTVEVPPRMANAPDFVAALARLYPPALRDSAVTGSVMVRLRIGEDGVPGNAQVVQASHPAFAAPTLAALETLRFVPAQVGGRPVPVWVELPVQWAAPAAPDAASAPPAHELRAVDVPPRMANKAEFLAALARLYPPTLRGTAIGGRVTLRLRIGEDGVPGHASVLKMPHLDLAEPALTGLETLRFVPAEVAGRPVPVWANVTVTWTLAAGPAPVDSATVVAFSSDPEADDGMGNLSLSAVEEMPRLLNPRVLIRALERSYPADMRHAGVQAMLVVLLRVDAEGAVTNVAIIRTSHPAFNAPTARAVQALRFAPGRVKGRPVAVWVEQPIRWTLAHDPTPPRLQDPPSFPGAGRRP